MLISFLYQGLWVVYQEVYQVFMKIIDNLRCRIEKL